MHFLDIVAGWLDNVNNLEMACRTLKIARGEKF